MLTNRDTGTAMFFAWLAMSNLLGSQAPLSFTVAAEYWSPSNVVSLKEMAKYSINNEAIQIFCYGYYDIKGTNSDGETVIDRDGGHCMTLVGAARSEVRGKSPTPIRLIVWARRRSLPSNTPRNTVFGWRIWWCLQQCPARPRSPCRV